MCYANSAKNVKASSGSSRGQLWSSFQCRYISCCSRVCPKVQIFWQVFSYSTSSYSYTHFKLRLDVSISESPRNVIQWMVFQHTYLPMEHRSNKSCDSKIAHASIMFLVSSVISNHFLAWGIQTCGNSCQLEAGLRGASHFNSPVCHIGS